MVGGDFNSDICDSFALSGLIAAGWKTVNKDLDYTCFANGGASKGSTVDHILINPNLCRLFINGGVVNDAPFPTHKPVIAEFAFNKSESVWQVLDKPKPFPTAPGMATENGEIWYAEEVSIIKSFLVKGDTDAAYTLWNDLAESELASQCKRSGEHIHSQHFGRGETPELKNCQELHCRSGVAHGSDDQRRLEKVRSGFTDMCSQWPRRQQEGTLEGAWQNLRRRLILVNHQLSHELPGNLPDRSTAKEWLVWVQEEINRRNTNRRYQALDEWRRKIHTSQSARIRWAKAQHTQWRNIPDTEKAFEGVENVWMPIMRKTKLAQQTPEQGNTDDQKLDQAKEQSVSAKRLQLINLLELSGKHLRDSVSGSPSHTGSGADGWSRSELLALPLFMYDLLADILKSMARQRKWHENLRTVVTSLIPKHEEVDFLKEPAGLRPISVASMVYRAFSTALAKRISAVLEFDLPDAAHGFRACEGSQTAMANTLLQAQTAIVSGEALYFITYDICKCFNTLPWEGVRDSLTEHGIHEEAAEALMAIWSDVRRIWKLQGRMKRATQPPLNGLFQGDPAAPHGLAAILIEPVMHIFKTWSNVRVSQYADDLLLCSHDKHELEQAHAYLAEWMTKHNLELHETKCKWACTSDTAPDLQCKIGGNIIQQTDKLDTLGGHFHIHLAQSNKGNIGGTASKWDTVMNKFRSAISRLRTLEVGWDIRTGDVGALMPMVTYSAVTWDSSRCVRQTDQRLLVNALSGGKTNTRRCEEASLGLLAPIHRVSLPHAILHGQVAILIRMLHTNQEFQSTVQTHYQVCSQQTQLPPGCFYATLSKSLQQLGWSWSAWDTIITNDGTVHKLAGRTIQQRREQWRTDVMKQLVLGPTGSVDDATYLEEQHALMREAHKLATKSAGARTLHELRDRMRKVVLTNASTRRRDMKELHCANRKLLDDTWKITPMICKATLRFIQQGTVLTAARMHRDSRGRVSAVCPFCDTHDEDEIHRYWSCVTWNNTRQQCLGSNTDSITQAMSLAPAATSMCAIPTNNMSPVLVEHWQAITNCMIQIHRAATQSWLNTKAAHDNQ
jgi:hypothetical protein